MPVHGYKIKLESTLEFSESEPERYGSWEKASSWEIGRIAEKVDNYPDVTTTLDLPKNSTAFVVWVRWSSGDSFGHHKNGYAEAIGIFADYRVAQELARAVETEKCEDYRFKFTTSDGQTHSCCPGWIGYFESLEAVEIDPVTIV